MIIHGIKKCKVGNLIRVLDNGNLCYNSQGIPLAGKLKAILPANVAPSVEKMSEYLKGDSLYPKTRPFKKDRLIIQLETGQYMIIPIPLNGHQIEKVTKPRKPRKKSK